MNHRIVSAVVAVIVILFAVAAVLFASALAAVTPAHTIVSVARDNPHPPIRRTEDCRGCHRTDRGTMPVTHRAYDEATCASCHQAAVPVLVPHAVGMGDVRCPLCHSDPARDFGMPRSHLRYTTGECLLCHPLDAERYDRKPKPAGLSALPAGDIPHPVDSYFRDCTYCHRLGRSETLPSNHRLFAKETCRDCHRLSPNVAPVR